MKSKLVTHSQNWYLCLVQGEKATGEYSLGKERKKERNAAVQG